MAETSTPRFVDEYEAAEITGVAVATLRTLRVRGGGPPFIRRGRSIRYEVEQDLVPWMRQGRAVSTADAERQKTARLPEQDPQTNSAP